MLNKKIYVLIYTFIIFSAIVYFSTPKNQPFSVLKVNSFSEFYIDFNRNGLADKNELVVLYDVMFPSSDLKILDWKILQYLANNLAKELLLNQKVFITYNGEIVLENGINYLSMLENAGVLLTATNKNLVMSNVREALKKDLVSYNSNSGKYHELDCLHAFSSIYSKIIMRSELPDVSQHCRFCNKLKTNVINHNVSYEKYSPTYIDDTVELFITDFLLNDIPSNRCLSSACQALKNKINSSVMSIDFAIYGIDQQPEILDALVKAKNRGVKIRWVYDVDKNGNTIYKDSFRLQKLLSDARYDIDLVDKSAISRDSIMHNKFFIIDSKYVWTGSANISRTDLSGFNSNSIVLIDSPAVASLFTQEFEKLYNGYFHNLKSTNNNLPVKLSDSIVEVYFSPQDKIIYNKLIPLIKNAKKYIYVPVFVVSHKDFVSELILAKRRGLDVKVIVDATSANSPYSSVNTLRAAGVTVKVENRAGKMHMKSLIIDDEISVIGSMNFSKSGELYNDENVLIIKSTRIAKSFRNAFIRIWENIPEKWLYSNPSAESINSLNSCFDGIDNDFDGKIDDKDDGCYIKK